MIVVSSSLMQDYMTCKAKVRYRRARVPRKETASMILGRIVHKAVSDFEDGIDISNVNQELVEALSEPEVVFYRGQTLNSLIKKKDRCLARYIELSPFLAPLVATEVAFSFYYADDVKVVGRYDQVRSGDIVVELKTSSKEPSEAFLKADYQTNFYIWAYYSVYARKLSHYFYFHLPSGLIYQQERVDLSEISQGVDDLIYDIRMDNLPKMKDGYRCDGCCYKEICLRDEPASTLVYKAERLPKAKRTKLTNCFADV